MLFRAPVLDAIRDGHVTLAFRRWSRPTVKAGGSLRTPVGVLFIESVDVIAETDIGEDDARRAGFHTCRDLLADVAKSPKGSLYRIAFRLSGDDPRIALRAEAEIDAAGLADLRSKLARLDRAAPWTLAALCLIGQYPGRPAAALAADLHMEKLVAKRRIRSLKELGLTESLDVGYRLSQRGKAFLNDHQVRNSPNG